MFMAALVQISAVTMAPDASWAVSVAADGTVRAWGSGAPSVIRQTAPVDVGQPVAVALSAEHLRVLWAAEATIRRYEAPPRDDTFPAAARVRALALSPSGRLAVVAGDDATLRTVNADTGESGVTLATGGQTARAVAVASDQGPVVAAFPDGSVRRYDLAAGTSDIVGISSGLQLIAVTPDGGTVIAAGADGVVLRWKPSLSPLPDFRALGPGITAIAIDGTGDKVLAGLATGGLWLHDLAGGPAVEFGEPVAPGTGEPGLVDEDVRFTVYRPQAIPPGEWASLLVFVHKTDLVLQPGREPVDPVKQVEVMARVHFGDMPVRQASADARAGVFRGARLRIVVDLPGITCNPSQAGFDWREPVHQAVFRLLAGPELVGSVVRGTVRVWCGPLLLGEVSLAIAITASAPGTVSPTVTESAPRYRKIFPSYSHDDRAIVDSFAEVARALGDQYLQDVLTLRSGERWRARLAELIDEADIFQLFWSSRSMRSRYCREEWEHALALGRPLFVRPLFWEDPMPRDPSKGLPPVALQELEFVKVWPPYLRESRPEAVPPTPTGVIPQPQPESAMVPLRPRRSRRLLVRAGSGVAALVAIAVVVGSLTLSKGPAPSSAIAIPTLGGASAQTGSPEPAQSLGAGVAPLGQLLGPATQCRAMAQPYDWRMPGLVRALVCHDPGLPGGTVDAFQLDGGASYQTAWANFNQWWHFDSSGAGPGCPPAGRQGITGWSSTLFPAQDGQVLECQLAGARQPAYAWTYPTEDAFIIAQGAVNSSFSSLASWWKAGVQAG
jgi:TIR domain